MRKVISVSVFLFFLSFSIPAFAGLGTLEYFEEDGAQCVRFINVSYQQERVVCIHDVKLTEAEKPMFEKAFLTVFEKAPSDKKSWCEIISFIPKANRVHLRFSDGKTYYAVGVGSSFDEAAKDLIRNFK